MKLFKRENYLSKIRSFYNSNDLIKVITGIRRCGKSSILEMIKEELLENEIKSEQLISINLDKKEYKNIKTAKKLEEIIDSLSKGIKETKYLFIDEIQNVDGFEELINAYREEGDYSVFITGSNSYLLSGELVTKLTGRYIEFEIYTLTFEEYVQMKKFYNIEINPNLSIELNNYILEGGFPRTVLFNNIEDKRTYVMALVSEIFEKDIKKI